MEMVNRSRLYDVAIDIIDLVIEKNRQYGDAYIENGELGIYIRLSDKFARLKTLWNKNKLMEDLSESQKNFICETLTDIVGYCLLWLERYYHQDDVDIEIDKVL